MDRQLQERLYVYEQEKLASRQVVSLVRDILLWLEHTSLHSCTEKNAGPFASHLLLALMRMQRGELLGVAWSHHVHEEAMGLTSFIPWVEHIQREVKQVLGFTLPSEEFDFLLLHIGAFMAHHYDSFLSTEKQ